jgi:hypothetical protein
VSGTVDDLSKGLLPLLAIVQGTMPRFCPQDVCGNSQKSIQNLNLIFFNLIGHQIGYSVSRNYLKSSASSLGEN